MMTTPLISYEAASIENQEAQANRAWRIDDDGAFRLRRNAEGAVRPETAERYWYQEPFRVAETRRLNDEELQALQDYLRTLSDLPERTVKRDEAMEGGSWYRLRFFLPDGTRELEVDSAHRHDLDELLRPVLHLLGGAKA